jgi:hypothetical protein
MVSTRATKYVYVAPAKAPSSKQRAPKKQALPVPTEYDDAHPLHDLGILQRIMDYVGPGNFIFLSPVSMEFAIACMRVPEYRMPNYSRMYKTVTLYDIAAKSTLFSAVFASPATLRHAHACGGLKLEDNESEWVERMAGRCASIETPKVALELGTSFTQCCYVVLGAAESGDIEKLRWLFDEQHCEMPASLCTHAARSGSTAMLAWLKQRGCAFTSCAMSRAMTFGHADLVRFLHAEGCPWSSMLCEEVRTHCCDHL